MSIKKMEDTSLSYSNDSSTIKIDNNDNNIKKEKKISTDKIVAIVIGIFAIIGIVLTALAFFGIFDEPERPIVDIVPKK
jgi:hypothetical protein